MNILILGNSPYLKNRLLSVYPEANFVVVPWRKMLDFNITGSYELLLVAGYDYGSYLVTLRGYISVNIARPFGFIKRFQELNRDAQILYVATAVGGGVGTYSRYRYAKERLGYLISTRINNSYILRFNSFTDEEGKIAVKGGNEKLLKLLFRCGLVKLEGVHNIEFAFESPKTIAVSVIKKCKGRMLAYPRTQFVDRLMRFCCG